MKKELIFNVILNLCITIVISLLGFMVSKVFINNLGINNLGMMKLFSQIITYLTLIDMGLSSAAAYYFYKPLNEKNWTEVSDIFSTINIFYKKISIIILILGLFFTPFIPYLINEISKDIYIYWSIYIINVSINYSLMKYTTLFLADQKYRGVRVIDGLGSILEKILQLYIIIYFKSFILFILVSSILFFIKLYFYKLYFNTNYKKVIKTKNYNMNIFKTAKKVFFHKISYMVVYNTDYIIIAKMLSLKIVGIYSGYLTIYNLVMMIVGIFHSVLDSKLGKIISNNNITDNYLLWRKMFKISFILASIIVTIFYFTVNNFIILWLGKEYTLKKVIIFLISINLYIDIIKWPTELIKFKYGYVKDIHLPIAESIINLCISLILVRKIGLSGVIFGTVISNVLIVIFFRAILVFKNCFNKNAKIYLKELIINLLFSFVSICFFCKISYAYLNLDLLSWYQWLVNLFIITFIIFIVTIIIFMIRKDIRQDLKDIFKIE